jgi:hypothetical protein
MRLSALGVVTFKPAFLLAAILGIGGLSLIFILVFIALLPGDWKQRGKVALEILLAILGRKGKDGGPDSPGGQSKVSSDEKTGTGDPVE